MECAKDVLHQHFLIICILTLSCIRHWTVTYLHNAKLVGNRRKLQLETLVTDLEYADDMALLAYSWNDLDAMLTTLYTNCSAFGLLISCSKTETMAVLPASLCAQPVPIHLSPTIPL